MIIHKKGYYLNEYPYVMYPVILISTEDKANVDGEWLLLQWSGEYEVVIMSEG